MPRRCVVFCVLGLVLLLLASSAGATTIIEGFTLGTYSGKTSQGRPFSFQLAAELCGKASGLCFQTVDQTEISMKCAHGKKAHAYANPIAILPASGVIHSHGAIGGKVTTYAKVTAAGRASGWFKASAPGGCTSGKVTFKAVLTVAT